MARIRTEDSLIQRIAKAVPSSTGAFPGGQGAAGTRLLVGIGDDAAVIVPNSRTNLVLTCDAFLEGSHFLADVHPADSVGYKSLARGTSDLAAMGAVPRIFFLTLSLPESRRGGWLDGFLRGMAKATRLLGLRLAGGDTSKAAKISIVITAIGEITPGREVLRSGARPGDAIYVSGALGRAQLGLELFRRGLAAGKVASGGTLRRVLESHLYPRIPVELGIWLARNTIASAMMDVSDGLSTDLNRLCAASRVGARVWAERIPQVEISPPISSRLRRLALDPLKMALNGGDDYELLFTVPRRYEKRLKAAPGYSKIQAIGEITTGRQVKLLGVDRRSHRLIPGGWDPFRNA
jgi:thiamine-monophosphate kinase